MTIGSEFSPTETGKLIEKQAENGSANGMYFLGLYYLNGQEGFPLDTKTAINWLMEASSQNQICAIKTLARLYFEGEVVEKDINKSLTYWKMASHCGDSFASYKVGMFIFQNKQSAEDEDNALYYLDLAAIQNSQEAKFFLGEYYLEKAKNLKDNEGVYYNKAIEYLASAATQGYQKAIAILQAKGISVKVEEKLGID